MGDYDLVRAEDPTSGAQLSTSRAFAEAQGLTIVDKPAADEFGRPLPAKPRTVWRVEDGPFDPAEHTVDEVTRYLQSADADEVDRVLAAEADGKARKGIAHLSADEADIEKENI